MSRLLSTRILASLCGMSEDRTRFVLSGDITTRIPRVWFSSLTPTIAIVLMLVRFLKFHIFLAYCDSQPVTSYTVCLTRTSSVNLSCWCLPTSRICPMPWARPRWRTNSVCTDCATASGTSRHAVLQREMDCTRDLTGCLRPYRREKPKHR